MSFRAIKKNKASNYLFFVMLITLVTGQALTGISECEMAMKPVNELSTLMINSNDLHAGHNMEQLAGKSDHSPMSGCCLVDCECAQNTCATSLSMIANKMNLNFFSDVSSLAHYSNSLYNSQTSPGLYRPPIIS